MRVLLTGGMGFIGSHTAVSLLEAGHEPILYDNLSNADRSVVDRIGRITGHTPTFIEGDIRDGALLKQVLRNEHIEAVIHFAGLTSGNRLSILTTMSLAQSNCSKPCALSA